MAVLALVSAGSLPGRVSAQAPAVLAGRVIPAGGGEVGAARVFARWGAVADSVQVDSAGRFSVPLPNGIPGDSVELWVDVADPVARTFHPALLRLGPYQVAEEQEIVLLPLRWTIRAGKYAGRDVEVPLSRAFSGACAGCSGFFRRSTPSADSGRMQVRGWPAERFPLRVAFDRDWNGQKVTARDSALFWSGADELEATFGVDLFRPVNYPEAVPREEGGPDDVILVWFDPKMRDVSGLGTAVSHGDDIEYGDLRLNRGALHDEASYPGLVAHELMHTLGFGHTCAWRSIVADVRRCPELRAPTATEQDVAYAELAGEIRALLRDRRGRWALEAALAAMEAPRPPRLVAR